MKMYILIFILVIVFGIAINWNAILINQRPTRIETIALIDSIIKADTLSIWDKEKQGIMISTFYKICQIMMGHAHRWELIPYLKKLAIWEDMREERARDKHKGK
ncbi:hypothetical protein ES707_05421 [subsurface metagenome]